MTCYVKALFSMGKQGTKNFARDFLVWNGMVWHDYYGDMVWFLRILGTCLTTFVFMSRLQTHVLYGLVLGILVSICLLGVAIDIW